MTDAKTPNSQNPQNHATELIPDCAIVLQVLNHADVDVEEDTVVTDPVTGTTTTMRLPKYFQIKCACC